MSRDRSPEALAHRRWLIGVAITLVFGIFGAVMAVLAYTKLDGPKPASGARRPGAATPRKGSGEMTPPATIPAPATSAPASVTPPAPAPASDDTPGRGND